MKLLLEDIRHQPLLWLLAAAPVVFIVQKARPDAHTLYLLPPAAS
jgi:Ca2+:H+ antiporter